MHHLQSFSTFNYTSPLCPFGTLIWFLDEKLAVFHMWHVSFDLVDKTTEISLKLSVYIQVTKTRNEYHREMVQVVQ